MNELTIYEVANGDNLTPYSTFKPTTPEGAAMLFKAMNQADDSLKKYINTEIVVTDIVAQFAQQVDDETGEVKNRAKLVFFDENGKSYGTISTGVYRALCNLCAIIGEPKTWRSPVRIRITNIEVPAGSMLSFDVVDFGDNLGQNFPEE